jgi:ComF family protein
VWVAAAYSGIVRQLLHQYKFERAQDTAASLGGLLHRAIPVLSPDMLITYVPTATKRVRERGYDHAKELAKAFARQRQQKVTPTLVRLGQHRQVGAKRSVRQQQLKQAYRVRAANIVCGKRLLLIDDILTTGATLSAAAHVLLAAGAESVDVLVVAQKQ